MTEKGREEKGSSRFVRKDEWKEMHWQREGQMGCCKQWKNTCWRTREKMTPKLVEWVAPEETEM